jgi:hypothetical protein
MSEVVSRPLYREKKNKAYVKLVKVFTLIKKEASHDDVEKSSSYN